MAEREASIIIPVFNQWELTRACLKALASTTKGKSIEVIVIDNASADVTAEACPFLGKRLFGEAFRYVRCTSNINFGPASNKGATIAAGEFLVFLNNDTVPQPGWYEPLIEDFSTYPDIAATGPLLLYPEKGFLGHTVQHLGVSVSPFSQVGHLYEGIPADSPLAHKRRFFQIITGACLVIRRKLFIAAGMFDENFINCFEDVDFCLRLWRKGYRMTVNPEARVIHHTSQTPGRHLHEKENSRYFLQKPGNLLVPDWHLHLKNDGLRLTVNSWLDLQPSMQPEELHRLDALVCTLSREESRNMLVRYPFWEKGWQALIDSSESESERAELRQNFSKLFQQPHTALEACEAALAAKDIRQSLFWFNVLASFCHSSDLYAASARDRYKWCRQLQFDDMAREYMEWLSRIQQFENEELQPLMGKVCRLARQMGIPWPLPS